MPVEGGDGHHTLIIRRITIASGLVTAAIGGLGLIGLAFGIIAFTSVLPGFKPIALSAALIWIFLGIVLAVNTIRPIGGGRALIVRLALAGIVIIEAYEFLSSLTGGHSFFESISIQAGSALFATPTTPISPAASGLIIAAGSALLLLFFPSGSESRNRKIRDWAGITGLAIVLISFTFVLSYLYGAPFLYNSGLIPMALTSSLAGFFAGTGIVAAASGQSIPAIYFTGTSTRARLLRIFVPLVILFTLAQNIIFFIIADFFRIQNALLLSGCIVFFVSLTALIIAWSSQRIGQDLDLAEKSLLRKNEDLILLNEQLTAMDEELRANNEELIRQEEMLRESRDHAEFLADILEHASQPFGVGYPDGKLGIVNRAFEDLTGYDFGELNSVDWATTLTPFEWRESEQEKLAELQRTGKPVRYEKEYIRKDGTRVPIELLVHLVTNDDGTPRYYYSFLTDITQRKLAEESLRENVQRLNLSLEVSQMGTWDLDLVRHTAHRTLRHDQIFGHEGLLPDWTYEMFLAYVLPEDREYVDRKFQHAVSMKEDWVFECRIVRADGVLRWITARGRSEYDANGDPVRMLGIVQDVTDRKAAELAIHRKNEELNSLNEELTATQEELRQNIDELTAIEHQLRTTGQYLENLIDYANAPIIVWDPQFTITRFNHAFERMSGRSAGEVVGQHLSSLFPEEHREAAMTVIRRTVTGERLDTVEIPICGAGSDVRIVLWNSASIYDTDGSTLSSVIAQGQDITDRKLADAENLRAREDWERTFNTVPDLIAILDRDHTILRVNLAMAERLRTTPEKCTGLKCYEMVHGITAPPESCPHTVSCRDGMHHTAEVFEPILGGDFLISTTPLCDADGMLTGSVHVARDITVRKKMEDALRETSQYLENLIGYASAPIIVWDPEFRITRFNHAFERLTGRSANLVLGQPLSILFPKSQRKELISMIRRTLTGERWEAVEIPIQHIDGTVRTVLWNSATLYEVDGKTVSSVIAQVQDITDRKRAEEKLQERNEDLALANDELTAIHEELRNTNDALIARDRELTAKNIDLLSLNQELTATEEELQQNIEELGRNDQILRQSEADLREALAEKEVLLSEIHHRVKNNLAAFISLISLDNSYEGTEEGRALKKDLQNRARSMALIHETLYQTGKYSNVNMGIYLTNLAEQIAASYATAKSVVTVVNADGTLIDIARATPCGLIINELVTNSFKYAFPVTFDCMENRQEACTIRISMQKTDGDYILLVSDNGIGLPEGLDLKTTQSLGLKLVNFLASHQLRATIDVVKDQGTEFRIRFRDQAK